MASPRRFERLAFRLGGGRSIQLSYGDMRAFAHFPAFTAKQKQILFIINQPVRFVNARFCEMPGGKRCCKKFPGSALPGKRSISGWGV